MAVFSPAAGRPFDSGGLRLEEMGETALIAELVGLARASASSATPLDLATGDDACVWSTAAGEAAVLSQDCLVEGVDFLRAWLTPQQLGRRALHVAVSDLAGMGVVPRLCLATMCAAAVTEADDLIGIQRGLVAAAAELAMTVAGGDLSAIEGPLVLNLTVVGSAPAGRLLRRDAGRPGDRLLVTGRLGRAAAGLRLLRGDEVDVDAATAAQWRNAQLAPQARVAEGLALVSARVACGGDISDGLLVEAARTAAASGCGAELWATRLPVDRPLQTGFGDRWLDLALGGGEEFELLIAVAEEAVDTVIANATPGLAPLTVVGRLVDGEGLTLLDDESGVSLPLPSVASRHWGP